MPTVSIIIPTCDRVGNLSRAISSIYKQTFQDYEIIIVNDGNSAIPPQIGGPRGRVIQGHQNSRTVLGYGSGGFSRNKGLEAARGRFVAFLDDDDQFCANKLAVQLNVIQQECCGAVCSDAYIGILPKFFPLFPRLHSDYYAKDLEAKLSPFKLDKVPERIELAHLSVHNFIITSTTLFDLKLVIDAGGFKNIANGGQWINGVLEYEDWELWRRIAALESIRYVDTPLSYYRRGSVSKLKRRVARALHLAPKA